MSPKVNPKLRDAELPEWCHEGAPVVVVREFKLDCPPLLLEETVKVIRGGLVRTAYHDFYADTLRGAGLTGHSARLIEAGGREHEMLYDDARAREMLLQARRAVASFTGALGSGRGPLPDGIGAVVDAGEELLKTVGMLVGQLRIIKVKADEDEFLREEAEGDRCST